jgi:hypothetical protein
MRGAAESVDLSFPRKRESREPPRVKASSVWIPAFAGMTRLAPVTPLSQNLRLLTSRAALALKPPKRLSPLDDFSKFGEPR